MPRAQVPSRPRVGARRVAPRRVLAVTLFSAFAFRSLTLLLWVAAYASGQSPHAIDGLLTDLSAPGLVRTAIGVTRDGTPIPAWVAKEDTDYATEKRRILLVGGLDGSPASVETVAESLRWFWTSPRAAEHRDKYIVSAVPVANPDGWASQLTGGEGDGRDLNVGYPPSGKFYQSDSAVEAQYLWRWIGLHAPDLVIVVTAEEWLAARGPSFVPGHGTSADVLEPRLEMSGPPAVGGLAAALQIRSAAVTLPIPAIEIGAPAGLGHELLARIIDGADFCDSRDRSSSRQPEPLGCEPNWPSEARRMMRVRVSRSAEQIATDLARFYGHDLKRVMYQPTLALISRLRLGDLANDESQLADIERIAAPYTSGDKPTIDDRPSASHWPGHLIFGALYDRTGDERYRELVIASAEHGFVDGQPLDAMPHHNQMSDSVFMGGPIQAQAGRLTGERRYFDMAVRAIRTIQGFCRRDDGLYRHSPVDEAAWGRGNGFPALGLALTLTDLPRDHPQRGALADDHRTHLRALVRHQDITGAWHQVINHPESYREFTSTAMIAFSMVRGMREGWLDEGEFREPAERAWYAVKARIGSDGALTDVCTGTGKQKSRRAYFDREAILGRDDRGGAMALNLATEWMAWERDQ